MTEKVKVPSGVDDAIKWAREKGYTDCGIILATQFVPIKFNFEVIARWMVDGENDDRLLDALVNGYEVELEYKVGDWVARLDGNPFNTKHLAAKVAVVHSTCLELEGQFGSFSYDFIDHATPEEIKVEKERRVWAGIGREVGEFKDGDHGEHVSGREQSESQEYLSDWYKRGRLKGFYPAESFISFEDGESNA